MKKKNLKECNDEVYICYGDTNLRYMTYLYLSQLPSLDTPLKR